MRCVDDDGSVQRIWQSNVQSLYCLNRRAVCSVIVDCEVVMVTFFLPVCVQIILYREQLSKVNTSKEMSASKYCITELTQLPTAFASSNTPRTNITNSVLANNCSSISATNFWTRTTKYCIWPTKPHQLYNHTCRTPLESLHWWVAWQNPRYVCGVVRIKHP